MSVSFPVRNLAGILATRRDTSGCPKGQKAVAAPSGKGKILSPPSGAVLGSLSGFVGTKLRIVCLHS